MAGEVRKLGRLIATAFAAVASCCVCDAAFAGDKRHIFDVAADSADVVVNSIAATSGDFILFPFDDLHEVDAKGVRGFLTVNEALDRALDGSGLEANVTSSGAITIRRASQQARAEPPGPFSPPLRQTAEDLEESFSEDGRIIITGTRIRRPNMSTPVPVTSVTSEEFDILSPTTLISGIDQLPQFVNNTTSDFSIGWTGSAGQSFLNLRGIGSNRTLILLDGRRIVSSTRRGTFDIGLLPEGLVDRVEIVTGGASATYGSDAVAGVVNFRLNTDFEGLRGHAQAGISERGDYAHTEVSLSAGVALNSKTHLLLAVDAYSNDGVDDLYDREWHESWGLLRNSDPNGPRLIVAPDVRSATYTYGGLIPSGPLRGTQFLENGQAAPFNYNGSTTSTQQGGDGVDVAIDHTLIPASDRQSGFAYLSRDLTPEITAYLQALYGRTRAEYDKESNYISGVWAGTIYLDNAYLPADVRQRMIGAGLESVPFSRYASRRDLGNPRINSENNTLSLSTGVTGEVGDWRLDAYYQYGENRQEILLTETARVDRLYRALDSVRHPVTGQPVCRSTLTFPDDGCVPTSFFGDGAVSPEAQDWILDYNTQVQELMQHVTDVAIDGEPFDLWAGPASVALGGSWRYDEYNQFAAPYSRELTTPTAQEAGYKGLPDAYSIDYPLLERATTSASHGKTNVWELYGETLLPLVRDRRFAEFLDLQAGLRYAYYEGSGGIWAWKAGLNWLATPELRLRGTVSRDIRAGTLSERYESGGRAGSASDPFLAGEPTYSFVQTDSGNPSVLPEQADTFTFGVVYQPTWLPGFGVAADYYDIKIGDAIAQLGVQTIVDECFAGDQALCSLIQRGESGFIIYIENTFLNVESARTRGVDVELAYDRPITLFGGDEMLGLRGIASYYAEASLTPYDLPRRDFVGQTGPGEGLPDYRLLLGASYARGPFSLDVTGSYISEGLYNLTYVEGVDINDNSVDSVFYANARVAYEFDTPNGAWELYLSVNNAFDQDPPIAPTTGGGVFGSTHAPPDFDAIGRRYAIGLRWTY